MRRRAGVKFAPAKLAVKLPVKPAVAAWLRQLPLDKAKLFKEKNRSVCQPAPAKLQPMAPPKREAVALPALAAVTVRLAEMAVALRPASIFAARACTHRTRCARFAGARADCVGKLHFLQFSNATASWHALCLKNVAHFTRINIIRATAPFIILPRRRGHSNYDIVRRSFQLNSLDVITNCQA